MTPLTNIKHNATPSQIHLKPHNKDLFILVPTPRYNMCSFQQKITRHAKGEEKLSERQSSRHNQTQMLKYRVLKITGFIDV